MYAYCSLCFNSLQLLIMTTDMTQGSPARLLLRFSLPLLAGNIFQQLYNLVDTVVVGRFVGANSLAAVGTTGTIMFFMYALLFGMSVGAGIVLAQYFGAKNYKQMQKAIAALFYLTFALTVVITLVGVAGAPFILMLLQVPESIRGEATLYMRICFSGTIFMAVYNASSTILRSVGDSRTPFYSIVLSSLTNVVCNLLFVLVFHWGTAGVAYGTIVSQALAALYCVVVVIRNKDELQLAGMSWRFDSAMARTIAKNGIPSAIQSALISLGGMTVQGLVNSFGTATMAAYTAAQRIDSIAIQVVIAIASSMSVFTGQNIGSGNIERIKRGLRATLAMEITSCVAIALLALTCGHWMLALFLDAQAAAESISIGRQYLTVIGIAYVIAGVMQSYQHLIRGAGDVNVSLFAGIAEVAGRVLFANLFVRWWGTWGIWIATPCSWFCGCMIPVVRYYSGRWLLHVTHGEACIPKSTKKAD